MKKSIAFLGSLLIVLLGSLSIAFGLKAQTKPAKKETTTKPVTGTTSVAPKPGFVKAAATTRALPPYKVIPGQTSSVVQKKAVQSGKRH